MTRLIACLTALLLLGAAPAPHWATHVTPGGEGGIVLGNPGAPVRLIEYASLTCPHCRAFHLSGATPLTRDYVATGRVAYEYRALILNGPDLAAAVLARCDGPGPFFRRVGAFYRDQPNWTAAFGKVDAAAQARFQAAPEAQKLLVLAQAGGLDRYAVTALGMPPARVRQCLLSKPLQDQVVNMVRQAGARGVEQTPVFFLNGQRQDGNSWPFIEGQLRARLGLAPKAG